MESAGVTVAYAVLRYGGDLGDQQGGFYQEPTLFHCPTTGLGGRVYGHRSMLDVIDLTQGGRNLDSLGRYIVAAMLNARAGRTRS